MIARVLRLVGPGLLISAAVGAAEHSIALEPEATEIRFRLGATLHTVEGTARLARGAILFDPQAGAASGEVVIDARSLETGNAKRDRVMHAKVLESESFPEIVFVPDRFEGRLEEGNASPIRLHGELRIHGAVHPSVLEAEVRSGGEELSATARFTVPYVTLGLKDPSKLLLRVAKEVEIELRFSAPMQRRDE